MSKYILNPEHIDATIITKSPDGTEMIVTKDTFNDYFAECMLRCGQTHLVTLNRNFTEETGEKKSFEQISETVISLTSSPDEIGKIELNKTANEQELKQKDGKRFQKRGSKETKDLNQQK